MINACIMQLNVARIKFQNWLKDETGANEIIAIILILVVVVALAVIFRDNITKLAEDIWANITNQSGGFTGGSGSNPEPPTTT